MDTSRSGRLPPDVTGFVVSISAKTQFRRLHLLGACHRVPGLDYKDFEMLGDSPPDPSLYDAHCAQCWAGGRKPPEPESEDEEVMDGDTSSSESSEPRPKKFDSI